MWLLDQIRIRLFDKKDEEAQMETLKAAKWPEDRGLILHALESRNGLSLVECELITGRTHQIRAMMAAAGTPLLGDGKYGKLDKRYDRKYQALYSYKLKFAFTTDAGSLAYLNGREFTVDRVDFAEEFFPKL